MSEAIKTIWLVWRTC